MSNDQEFMQRLLETFRVEAQEHLREIAAGLQRLQKPGDAAERAAGVEAVFRETHSLKGAARAIDLREVESVCQALENVMAAVKKGQMALSPGVIALLIRGVDTVEDLLRAPAGVDGPPFAALVDALNRAVADGRAVPVLGNTAPVAAVVEEAATAPIAPVAPRAGVPAPAVRVHALNDETIRIPVVRLDALLRQVEQLLAAKLASRQRADELAVCRNLITEWRKAAKPLAGDLAAARDYIQRISPSTRRETDAHAVLFKVLDLVGGGQAQVDEAETKLAAVAGASRSDYRQLGRMVDNLLEDAKKVLMQPFASLLEPLPRMMRDVCRDQGKDAELTVEGGAVEVDKRILEQLKDPLIHLVRNCVDHGLERTVERERLGKPARGQVRIAIAQVESSKVEVLIADDGRGIDAGKVKLAAIKSGVLSEAEARSIGDDAALALIFRSGVSTSPIITDLSGRGLGLAIVSERVEELGGSVEIRTQPGAGTTFRIVLPLTLATFRGTFVQAGGQIFVIPTSTIERAMRVRPADVGTVEGRDCIFVDGRAVSLVRLDHVLGLPAKPAPRERSPGVTVVVLAVSNRRLGFAVERVMSESEVLVKSLGRQLRRVTNIAAATVLGSGEVVPILNARDLLASAVARVGGGARPAAALPLARATATPTASVLVVEDSITSRMLIKGILESAGYKVVTAVDGQDGLTALKAQPFDLVVSDVQMPRMDGIELTKHIRKDAKLAELPVVLVTSLGTREDRERGIEAGASAYIIKASFNQSNLLETVQRLI